jgi:hypothetical protein
MDEKAQLEALETQKEEMIQRYMELQDQADALNESIYRICCDIEILNCRIDQAKQELHKAELKAHAKEAVNPPPANGGTKH